MFGKAVIIFGVLMTRSGCNAWNDNFVHKETWLNGVDNSEEYLLKLEEGIVYADESDVIGSTVQEKSEYLDIYNQIAGDEDRHESHVETGNEPQLLNNFLTTISTSRYGSQSTKTPDQHKETAYPKDVYSQLFFEHWKEVGVDETIKNTWGITYSSHEPTGECKSAQKIQSEVRQLVNFDVIRVHDMNCDGLINVVQELRAGQQVFVDIYCLDRIDISVEVIKRAIDSIDGDWSVIHTVSLGNELVSGKELVNANEATVVEIDIAIGRTKDLLHERGYHGFVVSTVSLAAMMNHRELCDMSDYISINLFPYWDGFVSPKEARPWLEQQVILLRSICGIGKSIVLYATGWMVNETT